MNRAGTATGPAALLGSLFGSLLGCLLAALLALGAVPAVAAAPADAAAPTPDRAGAEAKPKPKPKPKVTKVTPASGTTAGGFTVVLSGRGFTGVKRVLVGGTRATGVAVDSARRITLTAPAHAAGPAGIRVVTDHGASKVTSKAVLTYVVPPPALSGLSPRAGPVAGGTTVTITGRDLTGATGVRFGATAAAFRVVSPTTITATSPARAAGPVSVTVQTPGGTSGLDDSFTYVAPPTLDEVEPGEGPAAGSTVTISGTGFTADTAVSFDGVPGTDVQVRPGGLELTVGAPPHAAGFVDVAVRTPGGTATLTNGYRYVGAVTLTAVSPSAGPTAAGITVTLTGTGFTGDTLVTFGGKPAFGVRANLEGTELTADLVLPNPAATVDVTVATAGGSATLEAAFTYVVAPTLTAVSPTAGPASGGQTVTLTGTGFRAGMQVRFGGTLATVVSTNGPGTSATVTTPPHAPGLVDVTVTTPGGTATLPGAYTFVAAPTLTSVAPAEGPADGGQTVTLTGTGFRAGMQVTFDGVPATGLVVLSDTQATVVTPPHAPGPVTVTVTSPGGTASLDAAYTYVAAPTLTSVSPDSGPVGGGTAVTLTGSGFRDGMQVRFGVATAAVTSVDPSGTSATVLTPAHAPGVVDVTVTTPGGTATLADGFTYVASPTVTAVTPSEGPTSGGQAVTLTGTGFRPGLQVLFGGVPATSVAVVSATQATATTPAHGPGVVDVSVTTTGGTGSLPGGYTYVVAPTVSAVSPAAGPVAGGDTVTVTGAGFRPGLVVSFDGVAATTTYVSPTQATAVTPPHPAGAADVSVTTTGGTGALDDGYTYVVAPTVSAVSPTAGPVAGGDTVTVTGAGFRPGLVVSFDGVAAVTSTYVSPTEATAVTPAHPAGAVDVSVTTVGGRGTLDDGYAYLDPPDLADVDPDEGPASGGTSVTLTGTGLTGTTTVTFGGQPATEFTVVDDGTVTAVTPAHVAGTVDVEVTTPVGTDTLVGAFTFRDPPAVTSVDPPLGPSAGGTSVQLLGTGLTGTSQVTFDGVPAPALVVVDDTEVTVEAPAHAVGPVDVVLTTPYGTATVTVGYTYLP